MIDKQRKIAYEFFESNENHLIEELQKNFKHGEYYLKEKSIPLFDGLFGKIETLEFFLEWIINEKKVILTEETTFVYRDLEWLQKKLNYDEVLNSTQVVTVESLKSKTYRWKQEGGKLIRVNNEVSQ